MIGVMMMMSELELRGELQLYYNKYSSRWQPGSPRISGSLHQHLADPADLDLKRCLLYFDLVVEQMSEQINQNRRTGEGLALPLPA